ncbi:MAG: hypothetical protein FJX64_00745 [Alphaproteobacteria bacterium]|nr:hypothetical protein [Alphaproteobacteria bacterium]
MSKHRSRPWTVTAHEAIEKLDDKLIRRGAIAFAKRSQRIAASSTRSAVREARHALVAVAAE